MRFAQPTLEDSLVTPPSGENLNQFLKTTGNALNKGAYTGADDNYNFASLLDGDPADGFSVHRFSEAGKTHHFAGISSTTSVGAVLPVWQTGETASAIWKGKFVVYETGQDAATHDFDLIVDFQNSDISADVAGYSFTNAGFDSKGVVAQGTITRAATSNPQQNAVTGRVQAIIGQEGAVGVFHSDTTVQDFSYAGGFVVATPEANYAAWLDSFGTSPPPATRAASGAGTNVFGSFLNLGEGVRAISNTGFTTGTLGEFTLTLDGNGTNGDHGVTYLEGGNETSTSRQAFVAVLPTTNLGAPLVGPPVITTWPGLYHNFAFGNFQEANFLINFGAKTITATPVDGTGTTTDFDLRFNYAGVITGNVTRGVSVTARGLIGEVGLVGVFVDTRTGRPTGDSVLYGGFVADNPNN